MPPAAADKPSGVDGKKKGGNAPPNAFNTLEWNQLARHPSKTRPHHPILAKVSAPHVDSFNSIFFHGSVGGATGLLDLAVKDIQSKVIFDGDQSMLSQSMDGRNKIEMWIESVSVAKPVLESGRAASPVLPSECRERRLTYRGKIQAKLCWKVNGGTEQTEVRTLGFMPIMVRSARCHLEGKSPSELVKAREDVSEFGGYFIVNGNERLIRLLIVPRRNHPIALIRTSFIKRGPTYSQYGIQIRCVRPDQSSQSMTLHYLNDGALNLRFSYRKNEYMVPVLLILRALRDSSDKELFQRITMGRTGNTFLTDRVELLLRSFQRFSVLSKRECLAYIGSKFHIMLDSSEDMTEEEVGMEFLQRVVLVHLKSATEKFDLLLYSLVAGECAVDNPDSPQHQEILLGGHLFLNTFKEKLGDWLASLKTQIVKDLRSSPGMVDFNDRAYLLKAFAKQPSDIGRKLEFFLATGNLQSRTGLDLQQVSGYTIIAEKLNFYRYISHFHSVHRGAFFAELKTTTVRKLLPEAWGFLCPVHTPDGAPCGLLNHLSHTCKIVTSHIDVSNLPSIPAEVDPVIAKQLADATIVTVQLDGRVIGWCTASKARKVASTLRHLKFEEDKKWMKVPLDLEIGWVAPSKGGQYPGLMMRPVKYLANGGTDMVGSFEQVYLDVACLNEDVVPGVTTHIELHPTSMLSVVANLTPFSDFNQSPRNMYQCQMGKQAMGTPVHNFAHRTDNKLYRLQTGQSPVVRPNAYNDYGMDDYPNGMNAVVAVIAYTGYDMEDASIINKSAHERGYGYGTIYKTEFIDLGDRARQGESYSFYLAYSLKHLPRLRLTPDKLKKVGMYIDSDGLPRVGVKLTEGCPFYCIVDNSTGAVSVIKFKGMEDAYVDEVRVLAPYSASPIIGDKFSSRHGQKGVISQKWPTVDMPFSESGIVPDVIINPHAFPSRMTIGMFVESLAGKSGALHGRSQDATPFQFSEEHGAADFFGEELKEAGGITGEEFKADIYIGVVYYQRLRHMVSDKFQVRTTGPVHTLTQQPIKGRKRHGGIRLGEMERDSLLAHGTSFILQDRLMNCSDYSRCPICRHCGSILTPISVLARARKNVMESFWVEGGVQSSRPTPQQTGVSERAWRR
ncbi:DNA-directed RNA polymerase I subunit RPA2 [Chytridium lagenaria]|nr:DNA-directed RNA polymerase I subunit RPA2 [Chytridium lagenaria]